MGHSKSADVKCACVKNGDDRKKKVWVGTPPGMMCAYKLFDLDKNGYVDVTEFTRVLIGFGYPGGQCKARCS